MRRCCANTCRTVGMLILIFGIMFMNAIHIPNFTLMWLILQSIFGLSILRRLGIQDNAIGMDEDDVKESIGIAHDTGKAERLGRAGFRGIGIWAGLQACDRFEIVTKKIGARYRYKLT